jgi:rare lipoprotein A
VKTAWEELINTVIDGQYLVESLIDSGPDRAEFVARFKGAPVTLTMVAPELEEFVEVRTQMRAASQLQHPNLLRIVGTGYWEMYGTSLLYLAAEPVDVTLGEAQSSGALPESSTRRLVSDIEAALLYLHDRGLVYRNLEPHTTVRVGSQWKLADYANIEPAATQEDRRALTPDEIRTALRCPVALPPPVAAPPPPRSARSDWSRLAMVTTAVLLLTLITVWWRGSAEPAQPPRPETTAAPAATEAAAPLPQPAPPRPSPLIPNPPESEAARAQPQPPQGQATVFESGATTGQADYSSTQMDGRPTASGEPFDSNALTAAHPSYPLGTRLRITNLNTGQTVIVRVNDRGALRPGYVVRLTQRAARELGFAGQGSAQVKLEVLK